MFLNLKKNMYSSVPYSFSDFLICGGGLVGTTMACALAKHPSFTKKSITLIEASPQQTFKKSDKYSNRVSAISPFSKKLFERLGVWKHVRRFKEVESLKLCGAYSVNYLELVNNEENVVAYIVENNDLLQAVYQELSSLSNLCRLYNKNISNVDLRKVSSNSSLPNVVLEDGSEYRCQLLIGSDGINSMIRKAMDVNYLSWDYQQMAVVATLKISGCCSNTVAWQKFLPDGPVALLPLTNNLSSLVWSTTKEKAGCLLKMPSENFVDALNNALSVQINSNDLINSASKGMNNILSQLGFARPSASLELPPIINDVLDGSRAAFPLGFGHSPHYISPKVVLIGDAAHRVHPLAGQGVNLGFQDIACLENVLSDGVKNGRELGDFDDLKIYEKMSQQNNIPVMAFIELIHRIYTSNLGPIQAVGDICLHLANVCKPLKEQISNRVLFSRK